jgi:peptidoglycan/LPS O-acetylase OafA/YrhL
LNVNTSSLSPEEVRAAAEIYRELGPDYQSAVVESFLDRVISEIDARVDGRIAAGARASGPPAESRPARPPRHGQPAVIALGSMVLGVPLSAVAAAAGTHPAGFWGLLVVWVAIAAINIAYAIRLRPPDGRR